MYHPDALQGRAAVDVCVNVPQPHALLACAFAHPFFFS